MVYDADPDIATPAWKKYKIHKNQRLDIVHRIKYINNEDSENSMHFVASALSYVG